MANLLIVILSIALAAAVSVIAVNYAGTVYITAQADAQATEIVAQSAKVASALRTWSFANGGSTTLTDVDWSDGTATDLISGTNMYLDALPRLGSYAQGNGSSDYYLQPMPISNIAWGNEGLNFTTLFATITSIPVCNAIARASRGESAVPLIISAGSTLTIAAGTTGTSFSSVMAGSDYDCVYNDANSNSTLDNGESMFFLYKVF